jgi:TPP-dependent pyruvate/acetoin dehydrogenase alpha subunit
MHSEQIDIWHLYHQMYRSRIFEEAIARLWSEGLISGEMHLGIGEEAICAGVAAHLQDGDAVALDHRGTPPLVLRGTDLQPILYELLGSDKGLCAGHGGHMHLYDKERLMASSGIVGSSGPAAAGFALAAKYLRQGKIAVAYFGEGALIYRWHGNYRFYLSVKIMTGPLPRDRNR